MNKEFIYIYHMKKEGKPPVALWEQFSEGSTFTVDAGYNRQVSFLFENEAIVDSVRRKEVLEATKEFLINGYRYIMEASDGELELADHYSVEFSHGKNHVAQGSLMRLSTKRIIEAVKDKDKIKKQILEQALVVHELVHNITDDEDLPMLIEIIYLLENGQIERVEEIKELWEQEKLPSPYAGGLKKISGWFGYSNPTELFNNLNLKDLERLKLVFKKKSIALIRK